MNCAPTNNPVSLDRTITHVFWQPLCIRSVVECLQFIILNFGQFSDIALRWRAMCVDEGLIGINLLYNGMLSKYLHTRHPPHIDTYPPASRLLGKSPEYVTFYTDAYKAKAKNIQGRAALIGGGLAGRIYAAYMAFVYSTYPRYLWW